MVSTYSELLPCFQSAFGVLSQTEKLKSQREYFSLEEKRAESSESARAMVREGLSRLGFSETDAAVTINTAPSIQRLVLLFSCDAEEDLTARLPVDECLLQAAKMFFQG